MPLIILLLFSVLIAVYASNQGRSFLLWFLVSAVFTPLIGLIALLICSRLIPQIKWIISTSFKWSAINQWWTSTKIRCL